MKIIAFLCTIFICLAGGMNTASCVYSFNVSDMYQEAAWISLDLPENQRAKVDEIIVKKNTDIKKVLTDAAIFRVATNKKQIDDEEKFDLLNFFQAMKRIDDIRSDACSEIMTCLTPQQQNELGNLVDKRSARVAYAASMLESLNLDKGQQKKVFDRMLVCQQRIWSIASDTGLSWEQRKQRMKTVNTFNVISQYLTKEQRSVFDKYTLYMMLGSQE